MTFTYGKIVLQMMLNLGILTVSDKGWHGERRDESGMAIGDHFSQLDSQIVHYEVVPDEVDVIASKLVAWADDGSVDIIATTGGTGLGPRDVTPEATLRVLDKSVPGLTEVMRAQTFRKTPTAILSRAAAGIRGKCLIINLPGSPKAVRECLDVILPAIPHAIEILKGEITEHANTGGDESGAH